MKQFEYVEMSPGVDMTEEDFYRRGAEEYNADNAEKCINIFD